jgi:hypothetical protein
MRDTSGAEAQTGQSRVPGFVPVRCCVTVTPRSPFFCFRHVTETVSALATGPLRRHSASAHRRGKKRRHLSALCSCAEIRSPRSTRTSEVRRRKFQQPRVAQWLGASRRLRHYLELPAGLVAGSVPGLPGNSLSAARPKRGRVVLESRVQAC